VVKSKKTLRFFRPKEEYMATIVFAVAIGGLVLLLVAAAALLYFNWSEKTLTSVLSILLVAPPRR
jgi:hypothetical protein